MVDFKVELLGEEDISWGTGTFSRDSRVSPGSTVTLTQINASHVPLTASTEAFFQTATDVDAAIAALRDYRYSSVTVPGCPSSDDAQIVGTFGVLGAAVTVTGVYYRSFSRDQYSAESGTTAPSLILQGYDTSGATTETKATLSFDSVDLDTVQLFTISSASAAALEELRIVKNNGSGGDMWIPPGTVTIAYQTVWT